MKKLLYFVFTLIHCLTIPFPLSAEQHIVNTDTADYTYHPSVAGGENGLAVIVWTKDTAELAGNTDIRGQRYNGDGEKVGAEFQVNSITSGTQEFHYPSMRSVSADETGAFIVIWEHNDNDIYGRLFTNAAVAIGSDFQINATTHDARSPAVGRSPDANGQFVVAWMRTGVNEIYARRFDSSGVAQGGEFHVNDYTTSTQTAPDVAVADDNSFIIVWQSRGQDGGAEGVYGKRYNSAGVMQGSEFLVNTNTVGDQEAPSVAISDDGDFVVAWEDENPTPDKIIGKLFSSAGTVLEDEFQISISTVAASAQATVSMIETGEFTVGWFDSAEVIWYRKYSAIAEAEDVPIRLDDGSSTWGTPSIFYSLQGAILEAWQGVTGVANVDIYANFSPGPTPIPSSIGGICPSGMGEACGCCN